MYRIRKIDALQILDSRGIPTVFVEIELKNGIKGSASVPSGASVGSREAIELRDNNPEIYFGKGVSKAVENINTILAPHLIDMDVTNQGKIDSYLIELDNTINKSRFGANSLLAISLACARAAANYYELPLYKYLGGTNATTLPTPIMNIINGGAHATNNLDFQEFMIAPVGFKTFSEALRAGDEVFHILKQILKSKGISVAVGDEGGFAPDLTSAEKAIELIIQAIEKSGYGTNKIKICLDVAASEFYEEGDCSDGICSLSKYNLNGIAKSYTTEEMIDYLEKLVINYPIISIEDGVAENDDLGWIELTKKLSGKCQIVGDDLFVTNSKLLQIGINENIANSIIIKPNQIGTLTETLKTIKLAKSNNYSTIISHRSGETEDSFIADLAVAVNSGIIKTGSLCRSERVCKYNRLLKIENELGKSAIYNGIEAFRI